LLDRLGDFTDPAPLGAASMPCVRGTIDCWPKLSGVRISTFTLGGFGPGGGTVIFTVERYVQNV
jgi:hypothetical protein